MIFGGGNGHDIFIANDCNLFRISHSFIGYNYKLPNKLNDLYSAY